MDIRVHERIKLVREQSKMSQTEFAKKLGISRDALANIENNRLKNPQLKEPILKLICNEFGVSYPWLAEGIGEMNQSDEKEAKEIIDNIMNSNNDFVKKVLVAFAKMSEDQWKLIKNIIEQIESG